jgi:hypothetical protein
VTDKLVVYLVVRDDGNSQEAEIDIDSIWVSHSEAEERKTQITDAHEVWVKARALGEVGTVYFATP